MKNDCEHEDGLSDYKYVLSLIFYITIITTYFPISI